MSRWNRSAKILFLENFEMYIASGLTIHDALSTSLSMVHKKKRPALENIRLSIEQGHLLSKGLRTYIGFLPALISLIEHGERSGDVSGSLHLVRSILEREDTLIKTCLSALAYPVIIGLFACILTIGLMRGVMPQIIPLLKSLRVPLPLLTRMVMYMSEHVFIYASYVAVIGALLVPCFMFLYKKQQKFVYICHAVIAGTPILGGLVRCYSLSLMTRSLGSLISSGAHIIDAYRSVSDRSVLLPLRYYFQSQTDRLSQGVPLAHIFSGIAKAPEHIAPLISAGAASGSLGASLIRCADIIDRNIEHSLKRMTALIEPLMMIGIGLVVGAIALSIMIPIYDVTKNLQH
jgi:type IV pilus assembly protein PilC